MAVISRWNIFGVISRRVSSFLFEFTLVMGTRVKLRVMEDGAASGGEKQPLMQSFMVTDQLAFPASP